MTYVEGVPPSKHFRCITQRHVLRSPITQPNIPGEQVAIGSPEKAWLREARRSGAMRDYAWARTGVQHARALSRHQQK